MSFTVARRTREIGVRIALGGKSSRIVASIARRSLRQLMFGVMLGTGFWAIVFITGEPRHRRPRLPRRWRESATLRLRWEFRWRETPTPAAHKRPVEIPEPCPARSPPLVLAS